MDFLSARLHGASSDLNHSNFATAFDTGVLGCSFGPHPEHTPCNGGGRQLLSAEDLHVLLGLLYLVGSGRRVQGKHS